MKKFLPIPAVLLAAAATATFIILRRRVSRV